MDEQKMEQQPEQATIHEMPEPEQEQIVDQPVGIAWEHAYNEAAAALGDQIVKNRFMQAEINQLSLRVQQLEAELATF